MKQLLLVAALLFTGVAYAQNDLQRKKAEFYATEAISYFKLNESKKDALTEAKTGLLAAQKEMEQKKKAGEIKESELDAYRKKNVYPFTQKILNIIGVSFKELSPFNDIVHPKMNQIKQ